MSNDLEPATERADLADGSHPDRAHLDRMAPSAPATNAGEAFDAGEGVVLGPDRPYEPTGRTTVWRLALGSIGLGGILYGAIRILQVPGSSTPVSLLEWLVAALILHDGILAPIVTVFGFVMARLIPGRARAYIQGGLIAGALVTTFTVVEIYRQDKSQPGMALLTQNYTAHLLIVLAIIAVLTVILYLTRVVRDRARSRRG